MDSTNSGATIVLEFRHRFYDKEEGVYWINNKSNLDSYYLNKIVSIDINDVHIFVQFNPTVNCFEVMKKFNCAEFNFTTLEGILVSNAIIRINVSNSLGKEMVVLKLVQASMNDIKSLKKTLSNMTIVLDVEHIKNHDNETDEFAFLLFCKDLMEVCNYVANYCQYTTSPYTNVTFPNLSEKEARELWKEYNNIILSSTMPDLEKLKLDEKEKKHKEKEEKKRYKEEKEREKDERKAVEKREKDKDKQKKKEEKKDKEKKEKEGKEKKEKDKDGDKKKKDKSKD